MSTPQRIAGKVIRDPVDLRDLIYRPSLGILPEQFLSAALDPRQGAYSKVLNVRDQGDRPTCIGEALAALIDIQRIESFRQRGDEAGVKTAVHPASAAMLHAMALEIESLDRNSDATDIRNLRSGLKGFYNTGVCTEELWQQAQRAADRNVNGHARGQSRFDDANVEVMKQARHVTLGAYYRVRSAINDYHAALNEAGGLYVAAEVHEGWRSENLKKGVIGPDTGGSKPADGHAFAIVGYNRDGFLVFNSWGTDWGGYEPNGSEPLKGVALWPYADWAATVLDCWVLRLAAPTPDSFLYTTRTQGLTDFTAQQTQLATPSVRRLEILGHYIHLDDGVHVESGTYPSSPRSLKTTLDHLTKDGAKGGASNFDCVRLTLHGDASPVDMVMRRLHTAISDDRRRRVHGISLVWVNGLLSGAATALQPLFDSALKIAKGRRKDADERIEAMTRPVGRALWRDAKHAAVKAASKRGDAFDALMQVAALCKSSGKPLHLVTEGAGSLLLAELLLTAKEMSKTEALETILDSLTLVAPLSLFADYNKSVGRFVTSWSKAKGKRPVIFKPDAAFDERLAVGAYSRSWTDLVSRAFEETQGPLIGAPQFPPQFTGRLRGGAIVKRLATPSDRNGDVDSADVLLHADVEAYLRQTIGKSGN